MSLAPVHVLATVAAAVLGGTLVGLAVAPFYDLRRDVILAGGTVAFFVVRPFMADVVALAFLLLPLLYGLRTAFAARAVAPVVAIRRDALPEANDLAA